MSARPLEIKCETCGLSHMIPAPQRIESLSILSIDFDICPFCRTPRNQQLFKQYWDRPKCWFCKVPIICFGMSGHGKNGLCDTHYHQMKDQL